VVRETNSACRLASREKISRPLTASTRVIGEALFGYIKVILLSNH
jgi:hypothetical protein